MSIKQLIMNTLLKRTVSPSSTQTNSDVSIASLVTTDHNRNDYVKATLFFLDGSNKSIINVIPRLTDWGEPLEEAAMVMKEYVFRLCKHWVQIHHFEIEFGSVEKDGSLSKCGRYCPYEIPLNKVFVRGTAGQWLAPTDDLKWAYLDSELIP